MRYAAILRWVPVTTVMGTIFLLSHQTGDSFELPNIVNIDKFLHAGIYAALAMSASFAVPPPKHGPTGRKIGHGLLLLLFCLLYGATDEYHQSFIAGRYSSVADLAADLAGAACGLAAWYGLGWLRQVHAHEVHDRVG